MSDAGLNDVQGPATSASYRRTLQQRVNDPLVLSFGKASSAGAAAGASQGLGGAPVSFLADKDGLPKSVHLLTLKENGDGRVLLRLAHLYQVCPEPHILIERISLLQTQFTTL